MKTLEELLAENYILREDMNELEQYILELQTEIHELLEKLGE